MHHAFQMRMMDGITGLDEQPDAHQQRHFLIITKLGDRRPVQQLRHEVGPAARSHATGMRPRDVGVVQQRQRMLLRFVADQKIVGCRSHDLDRHKLRHALVPLRHPHRAGGGFINDLQQPVGTDHVSRFFFHQSIGRSYRYADPPRAALPAAGARVVAQPVPDLIPQRRVVPTGCCEKHMALDVVGALQRFIEELLDAGWVVAHKKQDI